MSDIAVRVENLGKEYQLGSSQDGYKTLRESLSDMALGPLRALQSLANRSEKPSGESFWALRDVSFEVKRGEVVGIIGRNGAGKSTLLKILSRITEPTEGRVRIHGRVGSLLEVGTGFHPELTGRENIYLNGAILGMRRSEIDRQFDAIVDFAEVEQFLDTPVKRYSSGMYVRLAFAVAAHLNLEILVVDEVLAVGDAEFQKKCLGKMQDVAHSGRTVLFVSHNISVIQSLCSKAIYLKSGVVEGMGDVDNQINAYMQESKNKGGSNSSNFKQITKHLILEQLYFSPATIVSGASTQFKLKFNATQSLCITGLCVLVYSSLGARIAILDMRRFSSRYYVSPENSLSLEVCIKSIPFVEGDYQIGLYIDTGDFTSNILDLASLTVTAKQGRSEYVPYPASNRGVVELEY